MTWDASRIDGPIPNDAGQYLLNVAPECAGRMLASKVRQFLVAQGARPKGSTHNVVSAKSCETPFQVAWIVPRGEVVNELRGSGLRDQGRDGCRGGPKEQCSAVHGTTITDLAGAVQ